MVAILLYVTQICPLDISKLSQNQTKEQGVLTVPNVRACATFSWKAGGCGGEARVKLVCASRQAATRDHNIP
jgi:hypothetical protein